MRIRSTVGSVAVAALLAACGGGAEPTVAPEATPTDTLSMVEVAGVRVDVPDGWTRREGDTTGFSAWSWFSPTSAEGVEASVSVDVACSGGREAGAALDAYLAGPPLPEFAVHERMSVDVEGARSGARFEASYAVPSGTVGRSVPVTRHGVMAEGDGVAALVLVEGTSGRLDAALVDGVLTSLDFRAATPDRVAACESLLPG